MAVVHFVKVFKERVMISAERVRTEKARKGYIS
jgi:hypothetical protein